MIMKTGIDDQILTNPGHDVQREWFDDPPGNTDIAVDEVPGQGSGDDLLRVDDSSNIIGSGDGVMMLCMGHVKTRSDRYGNRPGGEISRQAHPFVECIEFVLAGLRDIYRDKIDIVFDLGDLSEGGRL